jgi:Prenyltransferase and squalene oxidase repeat
MASPNPEIPHQNSKPPLDTAPVVVQHIRPGGTGEGKRFLFTFLICSVLSSVIHVILFTMFLFVTVNTGAATTTEVKTIETLIDDEKPKEANLTNDELGGLDPDQILNYNNVRVEQFSIPGPAKMDEKLGNSDLADAAPKNIPPPPGLLGSEGQGGGIKSDKIGLMNANMFGGGMKGIYAPGGVGGRSGSTREQLLREGGGNTETEAAVAAGLKWLVIHQAADGHWSLDGFNQHGRCNCNGFGQNNDIAATAFGLLPLLGAGETHKKKDGKYAKNVQRALDYLIRKQGRDGGFGGGMYAHGLASIAMCEAYAMTSDPRLKLSAQAAINYIRAAQSDNGGWRYEPRSGGDTSVVGWQVMALKSGQMGGLEVDDTRNPTLAKATKWLNSCQTADGGGYGYVGPEKTPTMTAVGLLCRLYLGTGTKNTGIQNGVNYLRKDNPPGTVSSMYYYYYATQVMHHVGGPAWEEWNAKMRPYLLNKQDKGTGQRPHLAGSWSPVGDVHGGAGGRVMMTSLAILTLEVYYRHLPLYRREMGSRPMAMN